MLSWGWREVLRTGNSQRSSEIDLIKGKATKWPLVETDEHNMVISGDDLEEAHMRLLLRL